MNSADFRERCIVTAVNEKYIPYLSVMLVSLVNSLDDKNYVIYIMHENLSFELQRTIETITGRCNHNVLIKFMDVTRFVSEYDFFVGGRNNREYLSKESYFRLLTPHILNKYSSALYLDCDIILKNGWTEIFEINLYDYYAAVVVDIWGNWECLSSSSELTKYRKEELGMNDPLSYFNSGVMLMNLGKIRDTYSTEELLGLATSKKWRKHDQDVLNSIWQGKVCFIDFSWNLIECPSKKVQNLVSKQNQTYYEECIKQPRIIHYASRKPWKDKNCFFYQDFWNNAIQSPFFNRIFQQHIEEQLKHGSLEQAAFSSIYDGEIGVKFIFRCCITYFKRTLHLLLNLC